MLIPPSAQPIQKVLAYITREHNGRRQLLVFLHRDFPEAGLQVPAGTVQTGEELTTALFREIQEESGLTDLTLVGKLKQYLYYAAHKEQYHERHVYHLTLPEDAPERALDAWEHTVRSHDEDKGMVFCYSWSDLSDLPELEAGQDDWVELLF